MLHILYAKLFYWVGFVLGWLTAYRQVNNLDMCPAA